MAILSRRALVHLGLAQPEASRSGPRTLRELFGVLERHQRARGRAALTIAQTAQVAGFWCAALGERHPVPLSSDDVTAFLEWMARESDSEGRLLQACVGICRTAHRRAKLPPPEAERLEVPSGSRRTLEPEEFVRFVQALPPGSVVATAAALVYLLAARESEVFRLRVEDVEERDVRAWQSKGAIRGAINLPVLPELSRVLAAYARPKQGLLLGTDDPRSLRTALAHASRRAGIFPPIRGLGWLRNQAITTLGEAGIASEVLSRVLRHSKRSRGLLGRYDQSRREADVRRALAILRWPSLDSDRHFPVKTVNLAARRAGRPGSSGRR